MKIIHFIIALILTQSITAQLFNIDHVIDTDVGGIFLQTAGDLDNDGLPDLVTASSQLVAWYRNLGDGTFEGPNTLDTGMSQTFDQLIVDLDRDNKNDILISYFAQDFIAWYRNLGNGNFAPFAVLASGLNDARGIAAGDLDGDDDLDLVLGVTNGLGFYWIEHLDGNGSYGPLQPISTTLSQARNQVLADIDGDNDLDILTNSVGGTYLSWFENTDGQGDFSVQHIVDANGLYQPFFELVDLNGDNSLDLLSIKNGEVFWRENLGDGNFGTLQVIFTSSDPTPDLVRVHAVDLDNDDDLDITFDSGFDYGKVYHFNIDGLGNFGPPNFVDPPPGGTTGNNLPVDIDDDGDMDLISTSLFVNQGDRNDIYWYENLTILGVQDSYIKGLKLSPNPVGDTLRITSIAAIQKVTIYQLLGASIVTFTEDFETINVSFLTSGVYFVEVQTKDGKAVKRIIKK